MGYDPAEAGKLRLKPPKYTNAYTDHTGKARFYFRKSGGKPVALPGLPWSPEFMEARARALAACVAPGPVVIGAGRTVTGTVNAAVVAYLQSAAFQNLAETSRKGRRQLIERFRTEHGDKRIRMLERKHVQAYVSALQTPSVQRNMLAALKSFLEYCVDTFLIADNPAAGVKKARMQKTGGFTPWTEEHVAKWEATFPVGSQPRLALALYLNFGVRISDVVRIGPRNVRGGVLTDFQPQKGSTSGGHTITVPLLEDTKALIAATTVTGSDTYLVTAFGKPYTAGGFGNKMRAWATEAGLPECTSHGLRKLCLIRLAELGLNTDTIMSISGHKNRAEIDTYVATANRKKMARDAIAVVETARTKANGGLPNRSGQLGNSGKKSSNIKAKNRG